MMRRPRTSTLFPYTTLFRSYPVFNNTGTVDAQSGYIDFESGGLFSGNYVTGPGAWVEDRKSTRLNSSHQIISYAVFCLKKKRTLTLLNDVIPNLLLNGGNWS